MLSDWMPITPKRGPYSTPIHTPLVTDLERSLRKQRPKLSRGNDCAKAMDYMLKRWPAFTRFPRRRPHLPEPGWC